jgi:SAM-dependent methyltransferase
MLIKRDFATETDPRTSDLRRRLDQFYDSAADYASFEEPSEKPEFWGPIRDEALRILATQGGCDILEVGAGKTSFGSFLGERREGIRFHVQDVTGRHADHLRTQADAVHIGDVRTISMPYDIIFSTFVWEHVTTPKAVLDYLLSLLKPGGSLFIISPRYDFPFYVSPSVRHYWKPRRVQIAAWLLWRRLRVWAGAEADFMIHLNPALLHRPWFRDADAIHWASWWDLVRYLKGKWVVRRHRLAVTGLSRRLWEKYLLLFVQISRMPPQGSGDPGR